MHLQINKIGMLKIIIIIIILSRSVKSKHLRGILVVIASDRTTLHQHFSLEDTGHLNVQKNTEILGGIGQWSNQM